MKNTILYLILLVLMVSCGNTPTEKKNELRKLDENTTTYYLIRHAEKDRSNPENSNPNLNEQGVERAKNWASYFDSIPLAKVYATNYNRTQQTASYTAESKSLSVESYDPTQLYTPAFQFDTSGKHVLVVGHSNTTPQFVNAIIGEQVYTDIDDSVNSMLYVVKVRDGKAEVDVRTVE